MEKIFSNLSDFASTLEKLLELAKIPLNENCLAMLLKKLPEKLGDPGKDVEDSRSENSNVSNFDEPVLLHTPFSDKAECFDPGGDNDEINAFQLSNFYVYCGRILELKEM
ncbi:hypothetical protein Tco_0648433 [Tanacetum coccineum]